MNPATVKLAALGWTLQPWRVTDFYPNGTERLHFFGELEDACAQVHTAASLVKTGVLKASVLYGQGGEPLLLAGDIPERDNFEAGSHIGPGELY